MTTSPAVMVIRVVSDGSSVGANDSAVAAGRVVADGSAALVSSAGVEQAVRVVAVAAVRAVIDRDFLVS